MTDPEANPGLPADQLVELAKEPDAATEKISSLAQQLGLAMANHASFLTADPNCLETME